MNENNEIKRCRTLNELLLTCPRNQIIGDNLIKSWAKINSPKYKRIVCSVSGGSDSDIMLDIVWKCDKDNKVEYVWYDTGLEYQATKEHLQKLEQKYGIQIKHYKAIKPIPLSCKEYGQPFISKRASLMISGLQRHDFKFEDKGLGELVKEYPKCKSYIEWWCNENKCSRFNILNNKWLKEFMVQNPPTFKVSNVCCKYAKKDVVHKVIKDFNYDLVIYGVRKSEGGLRATAYKSCFDETDNGYDNYRPLWWYRDSDKFDYENHFGIKHSRCYTEYGLPRTGCAGCPFARGFEEELEVIKHYEPKLYNAVNNIFGESYEYTRKYREFYQIMNEKEKQLKI